MNYKELIQKDLITDNTKELSEDKLFLKTKQNEKYSKDISKYITPKELIQNLTLKTKFIGITGTNGKTTTAFVLGHLLQQAGYSVGIQGTEGFYLNGEKIEAKTLTTPPIFTTIKRAVKYEPDFYIMEVSSHAIVQQRIEGIEFTAKILTSFSQDHLDYHKTMEEYKRVKESFFRDETVKVFNGKLLVKNEKCKVKSGGYEFNLNCKNLYVLEKPIVDDIPMAGEFNKMNFSLALKTASLLTNSSLSTFNFSLFEGVPGRMEIVSKKPLVIIDFAHTPDGMEKVLSAVEGKKIVVFGAGGDRDKDKRHLMGEVADKYAEYIIITEDNPRCEDSNEICKEIAKGIKSIPYKIISNRKDAIKEAVDIAKKKNYTLMLLGKGDENYIQYCDKKIDYSDRETVKKLLSNKVVKVN
ncbi:UDP-N-acetylmuramoylalanyl-D-glutamate--2,6-diaminopimelate ligase [Nautilia profundicola AmH]|uniref:UDP-N-acetylmuramoylalanyl-D-glutamate--2, 6-diaminopimelate ligase n=1 Tax=Nautilia profundicola (strain ATCC BAA-1463 / DSM 18972 / AmH) TaxID=598659 RepID=B9L6T3_NAUPA|nr:UDP-N-acetylmuramoyl-L-alanyl-D-glutamate--2,6-diaminopimelate ligase [Nautilia profundicola]ACM92459.1 UDP-N-acetylmuramoylalanyl-D-glutamate--2,6-diaminopimelate ligase [Nautilia profundicola AmH]